MFKISYVIRLVKYLHYLYNFLYLETNVDYGVGKSCNMRLWLVFSITRNEVVENRVQEQTTKLY